MNPKQYDAIIIGSGQAGGPLAKKLAGAGKKVALIEKRWVGGTCINDGCTPTKTWVASAKAAYNASNSSKLGVSIASYKVNMPLIRQRKNEIVEQWRKGLQNSLEATENIDLVFGDAEFTGVKTISVRLNGGGISALTAELFFINTGAKAMIPKIEGLENIPYLDSTSILDLDIVPEHLLIIGGNYIGLEFGQMFRRFGSRVTILERSAQILAREDADIATEMRKIFGLEDIDILTDSSPVRFERSGKAVKASAASASSASSSSASAALEAGEVEIAATINKAGQESVIKCSHVLVATGRNPRTDSLNLDKTGVATDEKGFIKVNEKLESNVKGIYALGDVKGGPAFTHISYNDYTIVFRNLLENKDYNTTDRPLPYCVFTDPQLGRIGISETEARKRGLDIKVAKLQMTHVARAIETGDTRGFMKAVVDTKTKKILGAAILGAEGGEIMSVLQMAMEGGITYDRIRYCVFAHPLYSESLNNLFLALED